MKKIISFMILILFVVWLAGVMLRNHTIADARAAGAAKAKVMPVPVSLTNVLRMTMPIEISTFGSVEPLTTVAVKPQITGILAKVLFEEGQEVKEGDLLLEIDPRIPEAALRQAEAVLAKDRVQLENAVKESSRQEILLKKGIAAQDVCDKAVTEVETLKAMVQFDEAVVDHARLQLSYCSIRAPVAGRTGNLLIHRGNVVRADDTPLVTINQLNPIFVRFVLPQQELARVRDSMAQGGLRVTAMPQGADAPVGSGTVTFVDNAVDEKTGTIQLKARFENSPPVLWPGQYVNVVLRLSLQENAVVIPESAVMLGQQGAYVYVCDQEGKVSPRPVRVARTVAGLSVIAGGLVPGELIVTDGQVRLRPGARVVSPPLESPVSSSAGRP